MWRKGGVNRTTSWRGEMETSKEQKDTEIDRERQRQRFISRHRQTDK